jgi:hypothetical protein
LTRILVTILFAFAVLLVLATPIYAQDSEPTEPTDNAGADMLVVLGVLGGAIVGINRAVKTAKPVIVMIVNRVNTTQERRDAIQSYATYLVSLGASGIAVFSVGDAGNLLAANEYFRSVPPLAGKIFTALVLTGGANGLYAIAGLFDRRVGEAPPETTTASFSRAY